MTTQSIAIAVLLIALLLVTFIPEISLCIPWAFGYTGGR